MQTRNCNTRSAPGIPRVLALGLTGICLLLTACSTLCPEKRRLANTSAGTIRQDYPACRWLEVVEQRVERGRDGELRVTVEWRNLDEEPYPVRMRALFYAGEEKPEKPDSVWSSYKLQPGAGNIVRFFSSTPKANRYRIEVESQSSLPW